MGVDGQDGADYAVDLMGNLQSLLDRAKSGTYQAPPVRRTYIPKAGSATETRPLGIPTFEDKVLQRAVVMTLEAVYEQDFKDCSYGFRPGRSAHQALDSLWRQTMAIGGGWIVDVDIRKFFDTIDHGQLRDFLQRRIRDGVLLRLIGKWLNAGVLEDGCFTQPETGSPQGGVISPMLSNIFLHYVLNDWFEREVQPRLKGRSFLIRYADDFVMGFSCEEDARRVMDVLPKRFEKYGLTIHPEKTRLVPFERPGGAPQGTATEARNPARDLRPAGLHALLGALPHGNLGSEAQDVPEPIPPWTEGPHALVSAQQFPAWGFPFDRSLRLDSHFVKPVRPLLPWILYLAIYATEWLPWHRPLAKLTRISPRTSSSHCFAPVSTRSWIHVREPTRSRSL